MPTPKREIRNGLLLCVACNLWLHPSRFRSSKREVGHGTVSHFKARCRACEQSERTDKKNEDRAQALVRQRAQVRAQAAGVPVEFFMDDLNWMALVPLLQTYLDGAPCRNCGHAMLHERDIQLEHAQPARTPFDFARHHARNINVLCGSCNNGKTDKDYAVWLDEQEDVRRSVASYYGHGASEPVRAPEGVVIEWTPHLNGTPSLFR